MASAASISSFGAAVADVADRMQCPPEFVAVPTLTALGSLIGRKVGMRPQQHTDWTEIPNIWGCCIGRPGMLKSPAMEDALRPLKRLEAEAHKDFVKRSADHEHESPDLSSEEIAAACRRLQAEALEFLAQGDAGRRPWWSPFVGLRMSQAVRRWRPIDKIGKIYSQRQPACGRVVCASDCWRLCESYVRRIAGGYAILAPHGVWS